MTIREHQKTIKINQTLPKSENTLKHARKILTFVQAIPPGTQYSEAPHAAAAAASATAAAQINAAAVRVAACA